MNLPTDSNGWSNLIYPLLMGFYIALDRLSVWKAARDRKVIGQAVAEVHKLVNGRSTADAEKIAYLSQRVAELTGDSADRARALAAQNIVTELKDSADAAAARIVEKDQATKTTMNKINAMLLLAVALCCGLFLMTGCAHYRTTHIVTDPQTKVVTEDTTSGTAVLVKAEASKVHSTTIDGQYKRTLGIGSVQGQGDVEMVRELRGFAKDLEEAGARKALSGGLAP